MKVALSAAARRDGREIEAHYARQSRTAARSFRQTLQGALRYLGDHPFGAPAFSGTARAKRLIRFPFSIVYLITDNEVLVVAIADERREPGTYDDRIV